MSLQDFEIILEKVAPEIKEMNTNFRDALTARERLSMTLRFLTTGDSYTSLQYLFRISKQSISTIIIEVCDAIIKALKDHVKLPETENQWMAVAKEFEEKWNFPHAIGAMDGKHVCLQAPLNSGTEFYNYKQYSSIVLLALVDADYNFMYVNVGCQGRISDGGVFKNTSLYRNLENKSLNLPNPEILQTPYNVKVPYIILCDKAFALSEYTMKPFSGNPERGSIERIFNYRLTRARRVVENAFGILSSVFRVLRKPMLVEPEKATKIVLATVYLARRACSRCMTTRPTAINFFFSFRQCT
ncbi:unnamed protein product [Parnassius mnemosyne]|uniref:DDE Tnp4 domain-containing protein n=1 Tax=Parnassius mnemosyne TaxID=213953 RepID=A0AAV1L012_9NEOP